MVWEVMRRHDAAQRLREQGLPTHTTVRFDQVTGMGEARLIGSNALSFPFEFMEKPLFTYGCGLNRKPPQGGLPLSSAYVLRYIRNDRGYYVGAEMGFTSVFNDIRKLPDPGLRIEWSLSFEGLAVQDKLSD